MSDQALRALDEIGGEWSLMRRLGGAQQGAWLIASGIERAVLKWHAPDDRFCNPDAPAVVEYLRAQGYPTPAWLEWGVLDDGRRYWIQEFVDARPVQDLTMHNVDYFIELVDRQRGMSPPTAAAWTAFVREWVPGSAPLPPRDLVHGDLSVANVLVDFRGAVHVIDVESAARGCAAYDLMAPAVNAVQWRSDPAAIDRLVAHAFATFDREAVQTCARAAVAMAKEWYRDAVSPALDAWLAGL